MNLILGPAPTSRDDLAETRDRPWTAPMATRLTPPFDVDAAWERANRRVVAALLYAAAFALGMALGMAL